MSAHVEMTALTHHIARLTVRRDGSGPFGRTPMDHRAVPDFKHVHGVGSRSAPLFLIQEPWSSDDGWNVVTEEPPCLVPEHENDGWLTGWAREYRAWAKSTAAAESYGVIPDLPTGTYYLLQTSLRPKLSPWIILGNDSIPAPPNIQELLNVQRSSGRKLGLGFELSNSFTANVVGPYKDRCAGLSRPLLGVVLLHSLPSSDLEPQLLLFDCFDSPVPETSPEGDIVLVVPVSGEMIIEPLCGDHTRSRSLVAWRQTAVLELMAALGINVLDKEFVKHFGKPSFWKQRSPAL